MLPSISLSHNPCEVWVMHRHWGGAGSRCVTIQRGEGAPWIREGMYICLSYYPAMDRRSRQTVPFHAGIM